mmetsp:Transcript_4213/g.8319  ORF Transcript_4213/g.8319 Transcript_4213/m.8319 type:complete len:105 (-) Transcript_4213:1073-1387(-)|eukprot:CAMPEP_0113874128 /NCGR_PEP_ID=MMETSP0780_2-20120614/4161_1 /TAXON_ID=652834 /ORGANISM="Palpitomonas bilix" /LENGTH=104 /DNA_ID=CAMNT_0000859865 /DNA_START=143 /DNA_END=457 /DNA_ORIENTATION=- /assembly_acc=CAM_ASM_000599
MDTVLKENQSKDYEPTEAEIVEYAQWIGMDVQADKDLLWIAREGLKAPLPEGWKPCKTEEGSIYYFNSSTGESLWDHPSDDLYKKLYKVEKEKTLRGGDGQIPA